MTQKNSLRIIKMRDQLKSKDFQQPEKKPLRNIYIEQISAHLNQNTINVLIGQRRVGKSWILKHFASKTLLENVFSINFEKDTYIGNIDGTELSELFFKNFLPGTHSGEKIYILLDEIQEVKNWHIFINDLLSHNDRLRFEILISSSTSSVILPILEEFFLKQTQLYHVVPFLYDEYSAFHPEGGTFQDYLQKSGLPEMILLENTNQRELSENYIISLQNTIIVEDIVKIFGAKDISLLKKLYFLLLKNCGKSISNNALTTRLKEENIMTNHNTIGQYVEYIVSTHLIHTVEIINQDGSLTNSRLYFMNDFGLVNYSSDQIIISENIKILNYLLLLLLRKNLRVYAILNSHGDINLCIKTSDGFSLLIEKGCKVQGSYKNFLEYEITHQGVKLDLEASF
ncbi:MAG TPA: AAA family ATPase [Candidatus Absconditabacterales bacterium]|nr:AAA family ATPase [Candidatus Absconditabacterales bacterium]